ncbi:MAG: PilZ domain-containing protein [Rhodospirillales bacterium]|nr:PilZ domain-containing protein [Rhodospirillales bacterium]
MANEEESRRSNRRRTLFGGFIFDEDGKSWDCSVSDISYTGVKVRSEVNLEMGAFVELKINKFNDLRRTKVMWVGPGQYGLQFLVKIDKAKDGMTELFKLIDKKI